MSFLSYIWEKSQKKNFLGLLAVVTDIYQEAVNYMERAGLRLFRYCVTTFFFLEGRFVYN